MQQLQRATGSRPAVLRRVRLTLRSAAPEVDQLMRRAGGRESAAPVAAAPASGWRLPVIPLPSRMLATALLLVFLGSGVALGEVAHRAAIDSLIAAEKGPLRVLLPSASVPKKASRPRRKRNAGRDGPENRNADGAAEIGSREAAGKNDARKERTAGRRKTPAVKHVFVMMLADQPYANVFGPFSPAPYPRQDAGRQGRVLDRYYAVAHEELANGSPSSAARARPPKRAELPELHGDRSPGTGA